MSTPLYSTDIIPLTSRPTLTVMDDGDYFVILDTSTGKISKILKTNIMTALKITYDNTTPGLTAETVQAALDELVVNLGSTNTVIESLKGVGWTDENLVDHEERLDTLEGTGAGSVAKAIADAVSPLAEEVDTNRLYSDQQYIELKAKADAMQVKCNTLQAEVYTDTPILQYGAVEIIGDGYEADGTPVDVSANVVDGSLEMEQKGLTITNLVDQTPWADVTNTSGFSYDSNTRITSYTCADNTVNAVARNLTFTMQSAITYFSTILFKPSQTVNAYICHGNSMVSNIIVCPAGVWTKLFQRASITNRNRMEIFVNTVGLTGVTVQIKEAMLTDPASYGLDHITDTDILADLMPYVDGTKAVGKMGVQILDADDNVTQTIFLPEVGNRVTNGTADSIKTVADGWEHTKRVSEPWVMGGGATFILPSDSETAFSNVQYINANLPADSHIPVSTGTILRGNIYQKDMHEIIASERNDVANIGTAYFVLGGTSRGIQLFFAKGTFTTLAGIVAYFTANPIQGIQYQLATPITTHYDLPLPTSGKTIHRFAGEEKIALYGTGLTFMENVLSVLSAVKFVAGVMTDITSFATITGDTVTFSGVGATDVVYVKVEHDVDRPLGVLEHTPAVSNTASRLAALEAAVFGG